jgi:hypothetical protein
MEPFLSAPTVIFRLQGFSRFDNGPTCDIFTGMKELFDKVAALIQQSRFAMWAGQRPPIYGSNYPYGRPVVAVEFRSNEIIATDVYGFHFVSPRFFDASGTEILP